MPGVGRLPVDKEMEIIPTKAINYLPFSEEPFSKWNENTDVLHFVRTLYEFSSTSLSVDGEARTSNAHHLSNDFYKIGLESCEGWVKQFQENVHASASKHRPTNVVHDFYQDPIFGKAAKYFVAWEILVQRALEDSAFYSIAHVLESADDLKCSIHLASSYYYKQACQTLRSFLEDLILPIHFCEVPQDYSKWIANNYRVPSMRTRRKDGMLDTLTQRGVLSNRLADEASRLYGDLNSFVHGSESRLINKGMYTHQGQGHGFKIDDLYDWCKYFTQTVDAGIQLLKISLDQWDGFREIRRLICTYCHNDKNFESNKYTFGGKEFTKYICQNCNHEMTFDDSWMQW
ncbi:MAG: hypothetical protein M3362_01610 [Acidobacteriota bacterium]|nr:hypothetical protein [Acidobacteriota bacterium]